MKAYEAMLDEAIAGYDFPCRAYDFASGREISFSRYPELESYIRQQLRSADPETVKHGLSNVLYWGYLTSSGRRDSRVASFRDRVGEADLRAFRGLVDAGEDSLEALAKLKLPQLSNISFLSKVLMFLDPMRNVTLDLQLARMKDAATPNLFQELVTRNTSLPVTRHNAQFYRKWCRLCENLAESKGAGRLRAADIERAFFHMVKNQGPETAAAVLAFHSQLAAA